MITFPELAQARSRARRRGLAANLVTGALLLLFVAVLTLVFDLLLTLVGWFGNVFWTYIPTRLFSPDALVALSQALNV